MKSTLGPQCFGDVYLEQLSGPKEYKVRFVRVSSLESKNSVLGTSSPARLDAWKVQEGQSPCPPAPLALCHLPWQPWFLFPWYQPTRDTKDLHGHTLHVCVKSGERPRAQEPSLGPECNLAPRGRPRREVSGQGVAPAWVGVCQVQVDCAWLISGPS